MEEKEKTNTISGSCKEIYPDERPVGEEVVAEMAT